MNDNDKALAIALVRAHMQRDGGNVSWVNAYTKVRWSRSCVPERFVGEVVGGHYRRKPFCARTTRALKCVCKLPDL